MADLAPPLSAPLPTGTLSPLARRQYAAMIWVQGRIFLNSFRTMRGGFELGARILSIAFFFLVSIGPATGMGFGAYEAALHGRSFGIAILLWVLCGIWQFFSALAPAMAGQNPDLNHLLRYPVSFGSWMLLYLVYGIASPSTLIGFMWTVGIGIGIIVARPDLIVSTVLTLTIFLLFNILLSRTILSWIERIMAQRRTREIITGVLLVFALAAQAFNPALHQNHRHGTAYGLRKDTVSRIAQRASIVQRYLPPGLATASISDTLSSGGSGALPLGGLTIYTFAVTGLLAIRLRSESRGENFSETARRTPASAAQPRRRPLLDYSGPVAAVFEKDLRYLLRSGPMLYALAVPLVMVFVLGGAFHSGLSAIRSGYALPLGIVWAFMGLTQLVSNNFGTEGHGIQFYFLSPTPIRTVVLAKNAFHLVLFALEAVLITAIVVFRYGAPHPSIATATLAWILFAIPLYLTAGNTLSILMPYRMNMTRMRRQEFSLGNGMISMLSQALILGIGAAVLVPCALLGHRWLATPILLALAGISIAVYLRTLTRIEGLMESHREALIRDIAK